MDEQGLNDAAILLMSLGEEEAAEVLRHLTPKEVQKLGETIARTRAVSHDRLDDVIARFGESTVGQSLFAADTDNYVRTVFKKALGDEKAQLLLDRILHGGDLPGIESLRWMEPSTIAELLRSEHPQIIAAILVHLDPEQSAQVALNLPEGQRNEVLIRVATLESIQPAALRDLNDVLFNVLKGADKSHKQTLGGAKTTADLLNLIGSGIDTQVLEAIRGHDPELAESISDKMFVFEDVMKLDDKSIQLILKEVASETLIIALKGSQPSLREKFLGNMSSRAAETLREDLESRGPVRLSEVEAQQKEILKTLRRLSDEGQVVLGGGGGGGGFV